MKPVAQFIRKTVDRIPYWLIDSLTKKLSIIFLLLISMLIITLTLISYNNTKSILRDDFIYYNKNSMRQMNQNFENYMSQVNEASLTLMKDAQFMRYLMDLAEDNFVAETYIQSQVKNMFYSRNDIEELHFFIPDSTREYTISRAAREMAITYNNGKKDEQWYKELMKERFSNRLIEPQNQGNRVFLTFHRTLIDIQSQKPLGILSISVNYYYLDRILGDSAQKYDEIIGVYDKNDRPYYFSDNVLINGSNAGRLVDGIDSEVPEGNMTIRLGDTDYLAIYSISDIDKWKTIKLVPLELLDRTARKAGRLNLLIGAAFLIFFAGITILVSRTITGPLRKLSRKMDRVGRGDFEVITEVRGKDEIARLSSNFNRMVAKINYLINEEYKTKLSERTARLKALETQINPHFLYNSLQAISTEALECNMTKISKMVEALAFTLRYCFKEADLVGISKELEHVKNYLLLQKARFDERLTVEFDIDEEVVETPVPKLSIQTLVENSIKHALECMSGPILIKIKVNKENDRVALAVSDNGPGISSERLEEINRELGDESWMKEYKESIGLKNLNVRLKLLFNEDASIVINSIHGQGTEVKIIVPKVL